MEQILNLGYLCKTSKKLSKEDMSYIAISLQCPVSEVGKVDDEERWDYWLEYKKQLSADEMDILNEKGLVVLLSPKQEKSVAFHGKQNVLLMGLNESSQSKPKCTKISFLENYKGVTIEAIKNLGKKKKPHQY